MKVSPKTQVLKSPAGSFASSSAGSSIVAVMIGMAIIASLVGAYSNLYASVRKVQAKTDFLNTISQINLSIANTANDANSWSRTIGDVIHNPAMSCLSSQTCANVVVPTGFVLWPAGANTYTNPALAVYDGTSATAGYTLEGTNCNSFSTTGNIACPIHVTLRWSTSGCAPLPCQAPVTVTSEIMFRPGPTFNSFSNINEAKLTSSFLQSSSAVTDPCAMPPSTAEVALCATPKYPNDTLMCTSNGYRCGRVYR